MEEENVEIEQMMFNDGGMRMDVGDVVMVLKMGEALRLV